MFKNIVITSISLLIALPSFSQKLTTSSPVYDCGQVLFNSPIKVSFTLKNTSSRSVNIKDVETSCGCTSVFTPKKHVSGNKDISVEVTYDAKQLGHFQKEVWIYEEGQKKPTELTIKGVVVAEIKDYSKNYPFKVGQIRTDCAEIEFDNVNKGTSPSKIINILNTTGETIEPVIMHLPDYIKAEVNPTRLAPEQGGEITITLLSDKLPRMGLTQNTVYLGKFPGDNVAQEKEIAISSILIPSFTEAQSAQAPKIQLSATSLSKADMEGKPDKLKGEIIIQNVGRSTLSITSMQMFTMGMQVSLGKSTLEPMETTKLKIIVNDLELSKTKKRPRILMITNDPSNPKVVIEIN